MVIASEGWDVEGQCNVGGREAKGLRKARMRLFRDNYHIIDSKATQRMND